MKKIMFNDKYGLTRAVLEGRKTQTRRIVDYWDDLDITSKDVKRQKLDDGTCTFFIHDVLYRTARYKIGEVVAVAQKYADLMGNDIFRCLCQFHGVSLKAISSNKGYNNKMFVRADLMPHLIRIIDIRVERLLEISDEDCLEEGVCYSDIRGTTWGVAPIRGEGPSGTSQNHSILGIGLWHMYPSVRTAYAALINLICGKDTWEKDPFVFVYDFELIKP